MRLVCHHLRASISPANTSCEVLSEKGCRGAPVSVFVAFERSACTVAKGEITKFNLSLVRLRVCAQCGSNIDGESERRATETRFHVGAFETTRRNCGRPGTYSREERLPWLHVVTGL